MLSPSDAAGIAQSVYPTYSQQPQSEWALNLAARVERFHVRDAAPVVGESAEGCSGVYARDGYEALVIAIRGTQPQSLLDVVTDISSLRLADSVFPGARVAQGFSEHASQLSEQVIGDCQRARRERLPIWLVGHSLGGAAAYILASHCIQAGIAVAGCTTFGSPRPGDRAFASVLGDRFTLMRCNHQRWVNGNDLITMLPPIGTRGFRHVGQPYYLTSKNQPDAAGDYRGPSQYGTGWAQLLDQGWQSLRTLPRVVRSSLHRHSMSEYRTLTESLYQFISEGEYQW